MTKRRTTKLPKSIRDQVVSLFKKYRRPAPYILHRTRTLTNFVNESPHNLLPSQRGEGKQLGWTVYLAFASLEPSFDGLEKIVVFPDSRENELPLQPVVQLGRDRKHDLKKAHPAQFPPEFVFGSLDELELHLAKSA